jgi:S-adenosylmethionine:tRNA ribosyltransferase-isomerase
MAGTAIVAPRGAATAAPQRSDFEFDLPEELIAQRPAPEREDARLLHVRPEGLQDERVSALPGKFRPGDVLVLNDTRVIPARLHGNKPTGGRVEALVERVLSERRALVMLRTSHAPAPGARLLFAARDPGHAAAGARRTWGATVRGRSEDLFDLQFDEPVELVLAAAGQIPLPPYIRHAPAAEDAQRYQTVYARVPGAVAAPTAGLHFTQRMLERLQESGVRVAYVTLHVGAGTFQPVRAERLSEHRMHAEHFEVPGRTADAVNEARERGSAVIAVGTTSVRALEASVAPAQPRVQPGPGETSLFILPGFEFRCVDRLLTNFHLPGSTLLMLACAFAGTQRVRQAYAHAVARRYRFFSYGDAMLLERAPGPRSGS